MGVYYYSIKVQVKVAIMAVLYAFLVVKDAKPVISLTYMDVLISACPFSQNNTQTAKVAVT